MLNAAPHNRRNQVLCRQFLGPRILLLTMTNVKIVSRRQFVEAHQKIVQGAAIHLGRLRFRIRPAREAATNSFFYLQYVPESCFCSSFLLLCVYTLNVRTN